MGWLGMATLMFSPSSLCCPVLVTSSALLNVLGTAQKLGQITPIILQLLDLHTANIANNHTAKHGTELHSCSCSPLDGLAVLFAPGNAEDREEERNPLNLPSYLLTPGKGTVSFWLCNFTFASPSPVFLIHVVFRNSYAQRRTWQRWHPEVVRF